MYVHMTWWCAFESTIYLIDFSCHHILKFYGGCALWSGENVD